ncbi:MAG: hypothetical protein AAGE52_37410 [Myxococcota bacterium]
MLRRIVFCGICSVLGCRDVPIGRQLPSDAVEGALPTPAGALTVRALEADESGRTYLLAEFEGTLSLGGADVSAQSPESRDGLLLAFDADGNLRWHVQMSATFVTLIRLVQVGDELLVAGFFRGTLSDGTPTETSDRSQAAFYARYNTLGDRTDLLVIRSASGFANVQAKGVDGDGTRTLRCGHYLDEIDFGGPPLPNADVLGDNGFVALARGDSTEWTQPFIAEEAPTGQGVFVQDCAFADRGLFAGGVYEGSVTHPLGSEVADETDAYVLAFEDAGAPRWARIISGPGDQELNHLEARGDRVLIGGTSDQPFDVAGRSAPAGGYVAMFNAEGTTEWVLSIEDGSPQAIDADNLLVSGSFGTPTRGWTPVGGNDGFVVGLAEDGSVRWSRTFGSVGNDRCHVHGAGDDVVVACVFEDAYTSGEGTALPAGGLLLRRFRP